MDHDKGRTSRASSTSSLGREVRCACQFFQSDSLLPERRAMMMQRPSSRNENKPAIVCEHEYEPVGAGIINKTVGQAPVVRIIDTDVVPVADSDDSIDVRGRFTPGPVLDDVDVILPLDGQIEDSAMEGRELGSGDLSEEIETIQQLQDRIEERFLSAATPCTESRTDGEVNTSQVDSSVIEELPLRRGARGLPQRLRSQAGKLRSRLKSIQRPNFTFPIDRQKSPKTRTSDKSKSKSPANSSDRSRTLDRSSRSSDKRTRMERIRASLPDRPKFNFPQKSKFHLPELPKMPSKPNFRLPSLPGRRRTPSLGEQQRQHSSESTAGSKKNIFDFSTVPRLFDRKSKARNDYTTSSPRDSRAESSAESATLPRTKKSKPSFVSHRPETKKIFPKRFTDIKFVDDDEVSIEKNRPWRRPSFEKPRLSLRGQESIEESDPLAWEDIEERRKSLQIEEIPYDEELPHNLEKIEREIQTKFKKILRNDSEDSYEPPQIDPRLYGDQDIAVEDSEKNRELYRVAFEPVDPRGYKNRSPSEEEDLEDEEVLEDEHNLSSELEEDLSARSDREQQASSGSSCDRRRRGVIEEIDSDEFFVRAKGVSQDDMHTGKYLTTEIRDALRTPGNALADEVIIVAPEPPKRPARTRSQRKRKESMESLEAVPPTRPKRHLRRSEESDYGSNIQDNDDSLSESRHRIVYHADSTPLDLNQPEPLDDIVIVKPIRRKSRTSLRSSSLVPSDIISELIFEASESPPIIPRRRKRPIKLMTEINGHINSALSQNGHHSPDEFDSKPPRPKSEPPMKPARAPSRETIIVSRVEEEYIEPAPIPPKRISRSRATSIIQDDDRTSRGAESIPDIGYDEDERELDNDSGLNFSGYAIIEKKENKPPRPPPPRRNKKNIINKFATTPRASPRPSPPKRPVRAYSTLRPRSRTPSDHEIKLHEPHESTPYIDIDSEGEKSAAEEDEEEIKDLRSGEVLSKMAGRPLPAPPRPPRSRKDKLSEEITEKEINDTELEGELPYESFASTQTDPLPDDLVIEEEITTAKLIVAPSRTGSQILVSTERIPSPQHFRPTGNAISHDRIPSPTQDYYMSSLARSEPDIRGSRVTPEVPPLPTPQAIYPDDTPQRPPRTRSKSPSIPRDFEEPPERPESRLLGIEELEERLSAFLTNETLKIASLEVGDLRVDRLSVSNLEANKISASEIDAVVVSATEITNTSEEENVTIPPSLLQELIAIRSQLECVALAATESTTRTIEEPVESRNDSTINESTIFTQSTVPDQLQLDSLSRTTETRAIYSTTGTAPYERPQIPTMPEVKAEKPRNDPDDEYYEQRHKSRSRSSSLARSLRQTASPVRSLPPVISVTPDTPDTAPKLLESTNKKIQRATISYAEEYSSERPSTPQSRPTSPSHPSQGQFIAFQTSQIPPQFFALATPQPPVAPVEEPGVIDMTQQLIRALRVAGKRAMRHFVHYAVSRVSREESEAKIREVELAICALLLIIVGLIIACFAGPKTITHHHHWDYFNPPRL